jgi:hypothetical protein
MDSSHESSSDVFIAYADDSTLSPSEGPQIFTFAGACADSAVWDSVTARWSAVLEEFGSPPFHANRVENGKRPFTEDQGWDTARRSALQKCLIHAVREVTAPVVAGAAIDMDAYGALSASEQSLLGKPHDLCLEWYVRCVGYLHNKEPLIHLAARIEHVFEKGGLVDVGKIDAAFKLALRNCADERHLAGLPRWEPKAMHVELQVADMLAYEIGKQVLRNIGAEVRPRRKSLEALEKGMAGAVFLLDGERLRGLIHVRAPGLGYSDREWTGAYDNFMKSQVDPEG